MSAVHELPTPRPPASSSDAASGGARSAAFDYIDDFGEEDPAELIGRTLAGRYELLELLGTGGMGAVYLGRHVLIDKLVAVKVLGSAYAEQPGGVRRFLREAKAASRIRHENVVDITDFGEEDGTAFMVMEFLEGEDLSVTLIRTGPVPWQRAVRFGVQISAALAAAHAQGVVHRDMKPENCFRISRGGSQDFIKVLDFGIARITDDSSSGDSSLINSGSFQGTPEYVAPELLRGATPDPRVDIYAVGVILYKLICGTVPFYDDNFMEVLNKQLFELPEPLRQRAPGLDIPESIERVVLKALEKGPKDRYQTIVELMRDLQAAEQAEAPRTVVAPEPTPPKQRSLLLWVVVAFALILAGVLAYVLITDALGEQNETRVPAKPALASASNSDPADEAEPSDAKSVALAGAGASGDAADTGGGEPALETEGGVDEDGDSAAEEADSVASGESAADEPDDAGASGDAGDAGDAGDSVETGEVEDSGEAADSGGAEERGDAGASEPSGGSSLPKRLSYRDFSSRMARASPKSRCSKYGMPGMKVRLKVTVGPNGRVKKSSPTGSQSGSSLGTCVAKSVRRLRFPKSRKGGTFRYTYKL